MNPFIESTVARPLPKNLRARRWGGPRPDARIPIGHSHDVPCRAPDSACPEPGGRAGPSHGDRDDASHGNTRHTADPRARGQKKGDASGRNTSLRGILGLSLGMLLSAASVPVASPVAMTGAVMLAGVLMPRDARAVDLNKASAQELQAVSGIGPKTASMIVDERTRGGNFTSLSDLSDRVRGIGPKKAVALQAAGLKVGDTPTGGNAASPSATAASGQTAKRATR